MRIDSVHLSGAGGRAVGTYGVDGLAIGTVAACNVGCNVGESGLLLDGTTDATVTKVDAEDAGTGCAAFRMADRNGRVNGSCPTGIRVGRAIARGGGEIRPAARSEFPDDSTSPAAPDPERRHGPREPVRRRHHRPRRRPARLPRRPRCLPPFSL